MKKLLLSVAVIAASGAYVAAENHWLNLPALRGNSATAAPLPSVPKAASAAAVSDPAAPPPGPTSSISASGTEKAAVADPVAAAAPAPQAAAADVAGSVQVAEISPTQIPDMSTSIADVAPQPLPRPSPGDVASPAPQLAQAASPAPSQGAYRDGSYRGPSVDAYYGNVQVDAVVKGGHIASVDVLQYPNDRSRSRRLSNYALPVLAQEVIEAQSASVDIVSGATLTSEAYIRSLGRALASARQ